jgi:hypothetical protein
MKQLPQAGLFGTVWGQLFRCSALHWQTLCFFPAILFCGLPRPAVPLSFVFFLV